MDGAKQKPFGHPTKAIVRAQQQLFTGSTDEMSSHFEPEAGT